MVNYWLCIQNREAYYSCSHFLTWFCFYFCRTISTLMILETLLIIILFYQDFATLGVMYLCNVVDGKQVKMPETLKVESSVFILFLTYLSCMYVGQFNYLLNYLHYLLFQSWNSCYMLYLTLHFMLPCETNFCIHYPYPLLAGAV